MEERPNVEQGLLAFMIAGMGANVPAPSTIFEENLKTSSASKLLTKVMKHLIA